MAAVGICGTDLHQVKGDFRRPRPMVLGHEGRVSSRRSATRSTRVAPGDEVVLSWAPSCGECAGCRRGRPATCKPLNAAIPNGTLPDGDDGDVVPRRDRLPRHGDRLPRRAGRRLRAGRAPARRRRAARPGRAARLRRPDRRRRGALRGRRDAGLVRARDRGGRRRPVRRAGRADRGCGRRSSPATRSTHGSTRRAAAGATHVAAPDELRELLRRSCPTGRTTPSTPSAYPETVETALRSTRDGGTTVIVGLPAQGLRLDLDPFELIRKEKRLTGTLYGSEDPAVSLPAMLEHVQAGRLELALARSARRSRSTGSTTRSRRASRARPAGPRPALAA